MSARDQAFSERSAMQNNQNAGLCRLISEIDAPDASRFGGKAAGLVQMQQLGIAIPPAFVVAVEDVAKVVGAENSDSLRAAGREAVQATLRKLEKTTGKMFGGSTRPLLVSVRSGAQVSMPGMMETVLNVGLTRAAVEHLAMTSPHFAWSTYREFIRQYGQIVMDVRPGVFADVDRWFDSHVLRWTDECLQRICERYLEEIQIHKLQALPDDAYAQLEAAMCAVARSWNCSRAKKYREERGISHDLGTAITVQAMVAGNLDSTSGTGIATSHDVLTGRKRLSGEFIRGALGTDLVSGVRTPEPLKSLQHVASKAYRQLSRYVRQIAEHRDEPVEVEFTVESGVLYILQVRAAALALGTRVKMLVRRVHAGLMSEAEAVEKLDWRQIESLKLAAFHEGELKAAESQRVASGLPASPGAAVGRVVLSSQDAVQAKRRGESVVLVRPDTNPDDLPGMLASVAIVTGCGGASSHAAVVARGLGIPAVVGCGDALNLSGVVSVNGETGEVFGKAVRLITSRQDAGIAQFLDWVAAHKRREWNEPRIDFSRYTQRVKLAQQVFDFYLIDRMEPLFRATVLADQARRVLVQMHTDIAEFIAAYLFAAVAGELRHADANGFFNEEERLFLRETIGIRYGLTFSGTARDAQRTFLERMKDEPKEFHIEFLKVAETIYNERWRSAFGGQRWAVITRALIDFLEGTLPHSTFVDHAFDLQHNTGRAFDKHEMISFAPSLLAQQLDAKKTASDVADLYARLRGTSYHSAKSACEPVEALFRAGVRLGLWHDVACLANGKTNDVLDAVWQFDKDAGAEPSGSKPGVFLLDEINIPPAGYWSNIADKVLDLKAKKLHSKYFNAYLEGDNIGFHEDVVAHEVGHHSHGVGHHGQEVGKHIYAMPHHGHVFESLDKSGSMSELTPYVDKFFAYGAMGNEQLLAKNLSDEVTAVEEFLKEANEEVYIHGSPGVQSSLKSGKPGVGKTQMVKELAKYFGGETSERKGLSANMQRLKELIASKSSMAEAC